jgi:phospholipid/cholesterol/gamma-HCH transport system permease protein
MLVADLQFGIVPGFYLQTVTSTVKLEDFFAGVAKTFVFGWIVAMVGCFVGLSTSGGTAGVGRATTQAVVMSSILVLVSDYFLTRLLMLLPLERVLAALSGLFA